MLSGAPKLRCNSWKSCLPWKKHLGSPPHRVLIEVAQNLNFRVPTYRQKFASYFCGATDSAGACGLSSNASLHQNTDSVSPALPFSSIDTGFVFSVIYLNK